MFGGWKFYLYVAAAAPLIPVFWLKGKIGEGISKVKSKSGPRKANDVLKGRR